MEMGMETSFNVEPMKPPTRSEVIIQLIDEALAEYESERNMTIGKVVVANCSS